MSRFKGKGVRCDWCGKFSNNENGEYTKSDGISAGYIVQPEWERFPGGDHAVPSLQSDKDICEECADDLCRFCGSDLIVRQTPVVAGPHGWGYRCKTCGKATSISVTVDEE